MEELRPEDIEDLLEELEGKASAQDSLPQEVEELLHVLQSGNQYLARQDAAEQLGKVGTSSSRIIRVLTAAQESDPYPEVRRAAAKSLQAPVHKEYLERNPDLEETEKVRSRALQPEEVELLLPILESGSHYLSREAAAEELGAVGTSSSRIVRALIAACESDPHPEVRRTATKSLRAPVHQEYVRQHPGLMEATERALQRSPGSDRQLPRSDTGTDKQLHRSDTKGALLSRRLLMWSSVAGLAVGLVIGLGLADPSLSSSVSLGCGVIFVVALTAGAVLGAVVGAVVRGPKDRITGLIVGAILAGVAASLSWLPVMIWRIIEMGGP